VYSVVARLSSNASVAALLGHPWRSVARFIGRTEYLMLARTAVVPSDGLSRLSLGIQAEANP
jgi:hypothetical protein